MLMFVICDERQTNMILQWSHGLSERTVADMLELMKQGDISDYIRSGAEIPHKHTEADRVLQEEVCYNWMLLYWCRYFF